MERCTRSSPSRHVSREGAPKGAPFFYTLAGVPLRVGVLGAGFAGAMHAHSALGLDDVRVVAIAALPLGEAAALARLVRGNFSVGSAREWYLDDAKSGGVVLDLMLHDLDTVRWWFGEPSRVYARRFTGGGGLEYALATIRYDDRPIVQVEASWAEHSGFRTGFELPGDPGWPV